MQRDMYANLFVLLVSEPGIGKTSAIMAGRDLLAKHKKTIKLASARITGAAFWDELSEAAVTEVEDGVMTTHHSLSAFVGEFGSFVRRGDLDFMTDLADMFDCPDPAEYKTRHQGQHSIDKSWFNFISGCTPAWVKETFTEAALELGFPARIILVYSDEKIKPDVFSSGKHQEHKELLQDLVDDLGEMLKLKGEFIWTDSAAKHIEGWVEQDLRPFPMDPRLRHYNTRRIMHVIKLAMVLSASRRDTLRIELEDMVGAQKLLLDVEKTMHKAIGALGNNPYFSAMDAVVKLVQIHSQVNQKGVEEFTIRRSLEREVPVNLIEQILDSLVASKRIVSMGKIPNRVFLPYRKDKNAQGGDVGAGGPSAESGEEVKKD